MFNIFQKMMTFQNVKNEILKCAWEQFPHVQTSRYGGNNKIKKVKVCWPSLLSARLGYT